MSFPLRCFQQLSRPYLATQALQLALQPVHQWYVHPGPLVLGTALPTSTRIADRDRTVSRRSEPSSRTTLIGEQPNPWDLLQPQDVMSRHRGAKHCRRYEPGQYQPVIPGYLLSVERWPFHSEPPDHYDRLSTCSTCQSHSQASLCHCTLRTISTVLSLPRTPPLLFGRRPPQSTTHHTMS